MRVLGDSFKYLFYVLGFILLLVIISEINSYFASFVRDTYRVFPWVIYSTLMYMPIGIYLGIPKLIKEFTKVGKWRVNVLKIIFVGFPMLYLSFYWYLPIPVFLINPDSLFSFGTIIAGYILVDSFNKEERFFS
ncbi:hypothetical protein GH741_14415 [Aquibacillus halophilus]|uniref:Uncharacterized protein n=1 Tax=Aquibacillus halophilus TaxID=930132 RepID=A0A6A8DDT7_9BACI|nr:hypothetical protein [Aquibacillus halophilus]MRH43833.1 hypothetical protein [Aquibacillus halophilus]